MKIAKESIILDFYFFFMILPFVAFQWKYDGYELPKYLCILIFGIIFSFIMLFEKYIKLPNKYFLVFLASFIISTLFSENFLYSFYGDYPRLNQNLILILSILIISIIYKTYLAQLNMFKIIFYQAICLSLVTFFEKNERVFSTLGQPNFLGIILVLGIIFAMENIKENKYYYLGIPFLLIGLFKTASITSIICLFFYLTYKLLKNSRTYWKHFLIISLICLSLILFVPTTKIKVQDNFNLIFNKGDTKITDSILVRFFIWKDTIKIPFENPKYFLIGTGPETFSLFYEIYRGKEINFTSEWDSLIDKPHNYFLEVFLEQGVIGFTLLILLIYKFYKSESIYKIYFSIILIYLFFNWANIFLQLILIIILTSFSTNKDEIELNTKIKFTLVTYILITLISFFYYKFEEIDDINLDFKNSKNPQIKIYGLKYFQDEKEIKEYISLLKDKYPNNLKFWFEIYQIEKKYDFKEKDFTKERIKDMRRDLVEWNEVFK